MKSVKGWVSFGHREHLKAVVEASLTGANKLLLGSSECLISSSKSDSWAMDNPIEKRVPSTGMWTEEKIRLMR